jgi:hypothetical protein
METPRDEVGPRTYATVIALEVAVLITLWLVGRYFGQA